MEADALRRLHYTAAIGCRVFSAPALQIVLSGLGFGLGRFTQGEHAIAALSWWATAAAGFIAAWATAAYLIAAAREHALLTRIAQRVLIALVFIVATAGGLLSRSGDVGGTASVISGLAALGVGLVCAYCGARLAYLNAEQI